MIITGAGVIDADYRGEVKVLLFNHGKQPFLIKDGSQIAQMILEKYKKKKQKISMRQPGEQKALEAVESGA
jgi:dUTPase